MADIKRCDRCGIIYEPYTKRINFGGVGIKEYNGFALTHNKCVYDFEKATDLCPKCLGRLIEWLNSEEKQYESSNI